MLLLCIPLSAVLVLGLLNFLGNGFRITLSNTVFAYLIVCFTCSIFLYQVPVVGESYSDLSAMLYLAFIYSLLAGPLLQMRVNDKKPTVHSFECIENRYLNIIFNLLIIITVPATLYLLKNIGSLFDFYHSGVTKGVYHELMDHTRLRDRGGGMIFYITMLFARCALFMGIYAVIFHKGNLLQRILLLVGACAHVLHNFEGASRTVLFDFLIFGILVFIVFYRKIPDQLKKKTRFYFLLFLAAALVPFLFLTLTRYHDELLRSLFSYFSVGPYVFNTLYVVISQNSMLCIGGNYCFPLLVEFIHSVTWIPQNRFDLREWRLDITPYFDELSGSDPGEFTTCVGSFIKDFNPEVVLFMVIGCFLFFTLLFKTLSSSRLSTILVYVCYAHFVLTGTIGFMYVGKTGNLELIFLVCFFFLLRGYEKKSMKKKMMISKEII